MSDDFLTYKTASVVYRQAVKAIPGRAMGVGRGEEGGVLHYIILCAGPLWVH